MRFSRQEYWSGLSFPSPGDLPIPRIEPMFPALHVDSLLLSHQYKSSVLQLKRKCYLLYLLYHLSILLPIHSLIHLTFQWKAFQSKLLIISILSPKYFSKCTLTRTIVLSVFFFPLMKIYIQNNVEILSTCAVCYGLSSFFKKKFFLIFWPCNMACGILVPWPGIEVGSQKYKHCVLTTGQPGNSICCCFCFCFLRPLAHFSHPLSFSPILCPFLPSSVPFLLSSCPLCSLSPSLSSSWCLCKNQSHQLEHSTPSSWTHSLKRSREPSHRKRSGLDFSSFSHHLWHRGQLPFISLSVNYRQWHLAPWSWWVCQFK